MQTRDFLELDRLEVLRGSVKLAEAEGGEARDPFGICRHRPAAG